MIKYYVTTLDGSYELVLGHNWLREWNPIIDWLHSVIVLPSLPAPELANILLVPEPQELFVQVSTSPSTSANKPHISFINALAY